MAVMTRDERQEFFKRTSLAINTKCDFCGDPIVGCLTYNGDKGEYCTRACLDEAEPRGKSRKEDHMSIKKSKDEDEEPKKKKKRDEDEDDEPKKKKKKSSDDDDDDEPKKKKKKSSDDDDPSAAAVRWPKHSSLRALALLASS